MRAKAAFTAFLLAATLLGPRAVAGPALLFDPSDGKVLYAEDLDNQWHPASLTKIMTAYLTFEALKAGKLTLEQKIPCSQTAANQAPGNLGLPVGAEITVDTALKALIIKSANDVAVMLAEAVAGSDVAFVAQMNITAQRLGMTRTTFVNPNGLPAYEQVTTARDLAKLARAVLHDFPEYANYWSMPDMRIGKRRLATHNGLLNSFNGADGIKTGFICDSGFNVVASATRDGHKLVAVVLGESTGAERTIRAASILEHGFQNYGWKELFNTASIDNAPIAPDAKGITSMRQSVVSWECGTGRKRAVAGRKAKSKSAKAKKKSRGSDAGAAASADTGPGSATAENGTPGASAVPTTGAASKTKAAGAVAVQAASTAVPELPPKPKLRLKTSADTAPAAAPVKN